MNTIMIGLDLAKNVFQVHGVDANGEVTIRRKLRRAQVEPFFARRRRAWWGWRRAEGRIFGDGPCSGLGTRCG
jgi:transposase